MKMNQRKRIAMIVIAVLVVIVVTVTFVVKKGSASNNVLTASGSIETTQVSIASEANGKVANINVQEGDAVKTGDVLFTLDSTVLKGQRKVAVANLDSAKAAVTTAQHALDTAKAQYQIALENALAQDKQTRLRDWFAKDPKQFDQPAWYFSNAEQIQAAEAQVDLAKKAVHDAEVNLTKVTQALNNNDFLKAEQRLLNARIVYLTSRDVNNRAQNSTGSNQPVGIYNSTHCGTNQGYHVESAELTNLLYGCNSDPQLSNAGRNLYDNAQRKLNDAQLEYNALLNTKAADEVLQARAEVAIRQEQYHSLLDFLRSLQTGEQSPSVMAAQSSVDQTQATVDQAQKGVEQAQANLDLLDTQISKLNVTSPFDGIVLTRQAESGETVNSGYVVLTIGQLRDLTITVYVPENRLGEVSIGETANVSVDSYPNEKFNARVVYISNQAEFTPRNVQTAEGRKTTVFAVKLKLLDMSGKLKPGMPSDVTFQ
ncbi:MAG TPA: efflux RND transporter periplasmic adaptor subunit [Anaerolineales bacterium]|nr:efflux RND transporter periplasmic adaptor subunit [Anaerolineales bacterium]